MKQKLTRALIDEIRKEMPVLNEDEKKSIIGGQGVLYIIGEDGRITYSENSSSDEVIIVFGSIDSGNIIRLPGDTRIDSTPDGYMITGSGIDKACAEYINTHTCVEWARYENSETGYSPGMNTSHHYRDVTIYAMPGCDTVYHNHEENPNPSEADKAGKGNYKNNYIFFEKDGTYHSY